MMWLMWAVIVGGLLLTWHLGEATGRRREAARHVRPHPPVSTGPPTFEHVGRAPFPPNRVIREGDDVS